MCGLDPGLAPGEATGAAVVSPGLVPAFVAPSPEGLWREGLQTPGFPLFPWSDKPMQASLEWDHAKEPVPFMTPPGFWDISKTLSGERKMFRELDKKKSALIMFRAIFSMTEINLGCSGEMGWELCAVWLDSFAPEENAFRTTAWSPATVCPFPHTTNPLVFLHTHQCPHPCPRSNTQAFA